MPVSVGSPGSIVTRGLGSPLLVTRGYGGRAVVLVIKEILVEPPRGRRPRRDKLRPPEPICYTIRARLIEVNGLQREYAEEHVKRVCFEDAPPPGARLVDVDVEQAGGRIRVVAELGSIVTGVRMSVSASLPLVTVSTGSLLVKAEIEDGGSGVEDVFIAVKRVTVRKDGDDE